MISPLVITWIKAKINPMAFQRATVWTVFCFIAGLQVEDKQVRVLETINDLEDYPYADMIPYDGEQYQRGH